MNPRNFYCWQLLLAALATCLCGTHSAFGQDENDDNSFGLGPWGEMASLNNLEPEQALEVLRQMASLIGTQKFADYDIAAKLLRELVQVSVVDESKCADKKSFSIQDSAPIRFLRVFCLSYLEHYVGQQFQMCRPGYESRFRTFLEHFADERKRDMRTLVDSVSNLPPTVTRTQQLSSLSLHYPHEDLVRGIVSFMETKEGGREALRELAITKGSKRGLENYMLTYSKWLVNMCINLTKGLESSIGIYRTVYKFGLVSLREDELTAEWLINYEICHEIISPKQSFFNETFARLTAEPETGNNNSNKFWFFRWLS